MIKGVSGSPGDSSDFIKKTHGWFKENIEGEGESKGDFGKAVAAGAAGGAAVGGVLGMANAIRNAGDAELEKVEIKHPIYQDKLEGYDQHADPMGSKWSLKFTPTVRQEKVGEYTTVDYKSTFTMGTFLSGVVGMTIGAIGGGLLAAGVKVLRDIILNKE
ncbi:MAG: hypothetical protein RDV48_22325 [Candidatus Eremiobacteraeota bacterium]|nr:hypothetical protein [Candidatus Eremiobacteraeota bacterium]